MNKQKYYIPTVVAILLIAAPTKQAKARIRFFKMLKKAFNLSKSPLLRHITHPHVVDATKKILDLNIDNFHTVEKDNLYRSMQLSPHRLEKYIKRYNLKTIINLRGINNKPWWHGEKSVVDKYGLHFVNIPMHVHYLPKADYLNTLLDAYAYAPRPMLIHCHGGADRTGEAAALWKLDQQKTSKEEALKELSIFHAHFAIKHPAKSFLIKIWQGRSWAYNEYNPIDFPDYYQPY